MSRVKNMDNAKNVSNLKSSVLGLLVCLITSLGNSVAYGMEYNNQGAQEARKWMLLANQISEGADADNSGKCLRAALSEENRKLLNGYSPSAVTQALSELEQDQECQALIAARAQHAGPADVQAPAASSIQALERPVELKLFSLLAHKQKLVTEIKDKEHSAAFKRAGQGWCITCLGVVVGIAALITHWARIPECPLKY